MTMIIGEDFKVTIMTMKWNDDYSKNNNNDKNSNNNK